MEKGPFGVYDILGYMAPGAVMVAGLEWTLGYPNVINVELKLYAIALLVLAVYVAGHAVATPAAAVFEGWLARKLLGVPAANLMSKSSPSKSARRVFSLYFRPLEPRVQERVRARAAAEGCDGDGEALFVHARFHEKATANERLMNKLDSFVSQYGFARNMAFSCMTVAVVLLIKILAGHGALYDGKRAVLLLAAGVVLLYRFLKFYRQYTYELLNNFGSYRQREGAK